MDAINENMEELSMLGEKNGFLALPKNFNTRSIHVGQAPEKWNSKAVVPPIVMSVPFKFGPTESPEFLYGRAGNPTRQVLETCLANLENAKYALTFSSGLGATTAVMSMLSAGDHFISGDDIYGGTNRLFSNVFSRFAIESTFVDTTRPEKVVEAIKPNTKLLWIETPTNPTLKVTDISAMSEICKKHNIILAVDNSFLTPFLQRPLELEANIVVYSLTKYMNGHADILMGAVITNNDDLYKQLSMLQKVLGIVPSPFDCSQVNRSLKTLELRMRQHNKNGIAVAKFLAIHPKVAKVLHPGLPSHPQYEIFKKQCSGHSGMVSFYHKKGLEESKKFLESLKVFVSGGSLGGVQSLAALSYTMTHSSVPKEQLHKLNITDNLIRLSVGTEDAEDLIADLKQALECI